MFRVDDTYFTQHVRFNTTVIGQKLALYLRGTLSDIEVKKLIAVLEDDSCEPLVSNRFRDFLDQSNFEAFSIVVQDIETGIIYASRDKWGRCGLLYGSNADKSEVVVGHLPSQYGLYDWKEIGIEGTYTICEDNITLNPWAHPINFTVNSLLPTVEINELIEILREGVRAQWSWQFTNPPQKVALLFSGGLDSTILAGLAAMEGVQDIDLISVSFDSARSPDRLTTILSYINLALVWKKTNWRLILRDVDPLEAEEIGKTMKLLLQPHRAMMDLTIGSALYFAAEMKGWIIDDVKTAADLIMDNGGETQTLFFGEGSDILRELDRIAGAAENAVCVITDMVDRFDKENDKGSDYCSQCTYTKKPGCVNGCCKFCCIKMAQKAASEGLIAECRAHKIGDQVKVEEKGFEQIRHDMQRRWDSWRNSDEATYGQSDAKIILCGNAADELFGGYGRYKTREMHQGLEGWRQEMIMDLQRLWNRNLGRDDRSTLVPLKKRAMIYHPFLSNSVVSYVMKIPTEVLRFGIDGLAREGFDTKVLLRQVAHSLGLVVTAKLRKRAIQFGSRAARSKLTPEGKSRRKTKGSDNIDGEV